MTPPVSSKQFIIGMATDIASALDCQTTCGTTNGCVAFRYDPVGCLYLNTYDPSTLSASADVVYGPVSC